LQPTSDLPGRSEVIGRLAEMLSAQQRPTLFAIAVHGVDDLRGDDPEGTEAALAEAGRRLSRLTRSSDLLGRLSPGVFVLVGPSVDTSHADVLHQRITGVFALPLEVGDHAVSLPVSVGLAGPGASASPRTAGEPDPVRDPNGAAEALLARAEEALRRAQGTR